MTSGTTASSLETVAAAIKEQQPVQEAIAGELSRLNELISQVRKGQEGLGAEWKAASTERKESLKQMKWSLAISMAGALVLIALAIAILFMDRYGMLNSVKGSNIGMKV